MKKESKEKAIYLRKVEGLSLGQISTRLGVSKSSVSGWVKHVRLTKNQVLKLRKQNPATKQYDGVRVTSEANRKRAAEARHSYQHQGRCESHGFNLHLVGCMLYWAEGTKSKNSIRFTNTDAFMMVLFLRFIREVFGVLDDKIIVVCRSHILSHYSLEDVEKYWINTLGLSNENLRKGSIETRIPKVKKVKYPYGICSISVNNTNLIQRIYGSIKQYAGINDENLWL
jgi:transposase-like protein